MQKNTAIFKHLIICILANYVAIHISEKCLHVIFKYNLL